MSETKYLFVGGMVAMGLDPSGKFLLTVSHSGRGVFTTDTWQRVARDYGWGYPEGGKAVGIGPLEDQVIQVLELDETCSQVQLYSPDGRMHLLGASDGVTIKLTTTENSNNLKNIRSK